MNLQEIERLIRKFENGETSLEEELELKIFFAKKNIPQHLAGYGELFGFYRKAADEKLPDPDFDKRILEMISSGIGPEKSKAFFRRLYPVLSIAAVLIVLIGIYVVMNRQRSKLDTFTDPVIAYAETKKILMKVSGKLNDGVEDLSNMKAINEGMEDLSNIKSFDEGMKNMKKISILDKSKDIITQKTIKQ